MKSELNFILQVEEAKESLFKRKNFSTSGCFNQIDLSGNGFITRSSIEKFLHTNKITNTGYIEAIFKRLDKNRNGRISFTEFIQIVTPANKVYGSEKNFTSVFSPSPSINQTPQKFKTKRPSKSKKTSQIGKFARFLMQQVMLEKELEEKRKVLALRLDFTIGKLFSFMNQSATGFISLKEFDESLRKLGILPELNQCHLLFRQYDRDDDNFLNFWDFCEIFNPRTSEYCELLLSRVTSKDQREDFSLETLEMIVDTFILILNIQSVTEELKQKLYKKNFNIQNIFSKIDMNSLGFLTKGCFRNLLRKYKFYVTERDLEGILVGYDSNKDGKITYAKFVQGICLKSVNNV